MKVSVSTETATDTVCNTHSTRLYEVSNGTERWSCELRREMAPRVLSYIFIISCWKLNTMCLNLFCKLP
jgi:hypothetical protein